MIDLEVQRALKDVSWLKDRLGIRSVASVYTLVRREGLPYYRIGNLYRFDEKAIEAWLLSKAAARGPEAAK